jgi:hypothetical protein
MQINRRYNPPTCVENKKIYTRSETIEVLNKI